MGQARLHGGGGAARVQRTVVANQHYHFTLTLTLSLKGEGTNHLDRSAFIVSDQALKTILTTVGWDPELVGGVEISNDRDPILPTPFRIGETAAASIAAVGLGVSDLWRLKTGRSQEVSVDVRRATASLRSGKYLAMDGAPVVAERTPVMGVYPTKDGRWSYLHCNFPNHRDAALGVLGVPEDREAVRKAVLGWNALELEEAIIAAKGAGGMARSM